MKRKLSLGAWLAACGGGVWSALYMWPLLDPFTLDVVFRDDWAQHVLGWLFYRNESLHFPLGTLRNFLHPLGTTLGYMDAIPWVALALRPFSALLPVDFQYLGLWIALTSAGLAYCAARVAALSTPHWEQQALAGVFTAMAPSLIERVVHPALCGHVFIVLALWLQLAPAHGARAQRRRLIVTALTLAFASASHPYIALMALALLGALPLRFTRELGLFRALVWCAAMGSTVGLVFGALGYLSRDMQSDAGGFGEFSSNVNTFVNSMGHSRIFRGLPTTYLQYEGYSYLGAGCFLLAVVVAGLLLVPRMRARVRSFPWRRAAWPLLAALALAAFAFASPWYWGEKKLFDVRFFDHLDVLTKPFRSSGRFIWALAYFINVALVTALLRALRWQRWAATGALLAVVCLQAYDLDMGGDARARFAAATPLRLKSPAWSLADGDYKHLVLAPAEILGECDGPQGYRDRKVTALAYLAYRHNWTFNSGYAARVRRGTTAYCEGLKQSMRQGDLEADTIYIVWSKETRRMRRAGASCRSLDGFHVCVKASEQRFARELAGP